MKYILFEADFDENDSDVHFFTSEKGLLDYFGDEKFVDDLIVNGISEGEWHNYHLVTIDGGVF